MTSVRAAGYSTSRLGKAIDNIAYAKKEQVDLKVDIMGLIEMSTMKSKVKDYASALELAKQAQFKCETNSKDLIFSVYFNLALQNENSQLEQKALSCYKYILDNNLCLLPGRIRVNMGNIYFKQKRYTTAIKMYRIALDYTSSAKERF